MGKGDKKSKRGKINIGSYGVKRRSKNADKGLEARLGIGKITTPAKAKTKPAPEQAKAPAATKAAKKDPVEKKPAAEKKTKAPKKES
jgi:30S ribosomal protein S31